MIRRTNGRAVAVRIICVLALMFLGLSHKMPVLVQPADSVLLSEAYALPDGSAPDLCVPQPSGNLKTTYPDCDACRLSASVILPPPPHLLPMDRIAAREALLPGDAREIAGGERLAALPRGPPGRFFS